MKESVQQRRADISRAIVGCLYLLFLSLAACDGAPPPSPPPTPAVTGLARVTPSPLPDQVAPLPLASATPRPTSPSAPTPDPTLPPTPPETATPVPTATATEAPTSTPDAPPPTSLPAIPSATPDAAATAPPADDFSWRTSYYANRDLEGQPAVVRRSAAINYNWGTAAPAPGVADGDFSARWTRRASFDSGQYIFYARSSDGVRVYINDVAIIDRWAAGRPALYAVPIGLQSGDYDLRVEHFSAGGSAELQVWWEDAAIAAWTGSYFANPELVAPAALVRSDEAVSFDWETFAPDQSLPIDNFSARWVDTLLFEAGLYRFSATADDGIRLYVDGLRVLDLWRDGGVSGDAEIWLPAGDHRILVEYYERRQRAAVAVSWTRLAFDVTLWLGEYYDNPNFLGVPVRISDDDEPDFTWGLDSPAPGVPADLFAVRWTRDLSFEEGIWQFRAVSNGGVRVFVGDQLVLDSWEAGSAATERSNNAIIGGQHRVVIEYYDPGAAAQISVAWTRLGPAPK